jgi:hypothetical protein
VFESWHNSFLFITKVQRKEENNKDDSNNSKCFISLCWKYKCVVKVNKTFISYPSVPYKCEITEFVAYTTACSDEILLGSG